MLALPDLVHSNNRSKRYLLAGNRFEGYYHLQANRRKILVNLQAWGQFPSSWRHHWDTKSGTASPTTETTIQSSNRCNLLHTRMTPSGSSIIFHGAASSQKTNFARYFRQLVISNDKCGTKILCNHWTFFWCPNPCQMAPATRQIDEKVET